MAYKAKKTAKKRAARKTVAKPEVKIEASRTPLEEAGCPSVVLPESANAAPAPIVVDVAEVAEGFTATLGENSEPEPVIANIDLPGASEHVTIMLRKYEWQDLLDILEGSESVKVSINRIATQLS